MGTIEGRGLLDDSSVNAIRTITTGGSGLVKENCRKDAWVPLGGGFSPGVVTFWVLWRRDLRVHVFLGCDVYVSLFSYFLFLGVAINY